MEGTGGAPTSQQYKSSVVSPTSSVPKQRNHYSDRPCLDSSNVGSRMHQFTPNLSPESGQNSKKSGIPSPHPHLPPSPSYSGSRHLRTQNFRSEPSHARSLSQPQIFSLDCLLPLTPSPYREPGSTLLSDPISMDVPKEELYTASRGGSSWRVETNQHRRGHRRSNSDIPFGFSTVIHSSPQGNLDSLIPGRASSGVDSTMQSAKQELYSEREGERKSEREVVDDLFTTYMNLDSINSLNSSGIGANNFDSRASGTKRSGGDNGGNDVKISKNGNPNGGQGKAKEREEEVKRSEGDNVAPTQHFRSVSMDGFITDAHFGNESPKPPPSPETQLAQKFQVNSLDDNSANFRLGFGNGEFSAVEMEKIMANERLAEIASSDPKRAKRILANRQSAARSKERKMRYISELEHKVQTLQTEATTLSAQVTLLQRDTAAVTSQNSELKFRIQAMEQEAQLKDALNQTLSVEVQRLRLAAAGLNGDSQVSSRTVKTALYESSDVPPTGSTPPSAGSGSKCQRQ